MRQSIAPLGIAKLSNLLKKVDLDLDAAQITDILWLAIQIREVNTTLIPETEVEESITPPEIKIIDIESVPPPAINPVDIQPSASAYLPDSPSNQSQNKSVSDGIPFKAPTAPGLRDTLGLARALRSLMRKVPAPNKMILDEEETVTQIAEKDIWTPVIKPALERWLDLAIVVEESRSIVLWQEIISDFQKLTELQGAFRYVRVWSIKSDDNDEIKLFSRQELSGDKKRYSSEKELLDPAGRRLVLLVSDCISPLWRNGKIHKFLNSLSYIQPLAIVQFLPERLWTRTALGAGFPVHLSALAPGISNNKLRVDGLPIWEEIDITNAVKLPIITLEPDSLRQWSRVVAGVGSSRTAGILFDLSLVASLAESFLSESLSINNERLSATDLVKRFRATASPTARRLAGLIAAVPVSLPVVYLIQQTLLKESRSVHVAEVFMSGLLQPINSDNSTSNSNMVQYEFVEGVRELLIDSVRISDVKTVLEAVSQYIARKLGISIKSFKALLSANLDLAQKEQIMPFATITIQVLERLGGESAALAKQLKSTIVVPDIAILPNPKLPPLQTFEFEVATISFETEIDTLSATITPDIDLQPFAFEVAIIDIVGQASGLSWLTQTELIIKRSIEQARGFTEDLGNNVQLEMVAIPEGSFMMGSPENEEGHRESESPQHEVTVKAFCIGKYPITQAQWETVAALPQLSHSLDSNPSNFKGKNRPVENISWYDAVEFCARLSQKTSRNYRLPSEAEWEYACRAGTTTPFHFGETITTDLANYDGTDYKDNKWSGSYGQGPKGIYRKETTSVGSFQVANAFGLYDMHGNVWEWCADPWHENYEGAPKDGSVWDENYHDNHYLNDINLLVNMKNEDGRRLLRGGSWNYYPGACRAAIRNFNDAPAIRDNNIGFRVVCLIALTP